MWTGRTAQPIFDDLWLNRRGLMQGDAFWKSHKKNLFEGDYSFPKNFKGHFAWKYKKVECR
jgi:hypothetical protein